MYEAHNFFTPDKVDYSGLTHLNYGFAVVKNGVVTMHDTDKAPGLIKDLDKRTEAANVAHMISVGGWNNSQEGVFENATATDAGLEKLANSMVSYMAQWNFDGLDIDWEYPDTEAEKAQFTKLIQSLRSKLDAQGLKDDKYYQLSAAVTTNHNNIQYINPAVTAPLLDSVNVMAYDIHGAFDPLTGHNAPLYENSHDEDKDLNVADTMNAYVETWQVPKAKLMMGIPYYGRGWGHVPGTELIPGLPGMFNTGAATVKGAWDDAKDFTGTNPWYVLKQKLNTGEYTRYWDSESHVPYLYSETTQEFLTYDDPQSIREKVDYINEQGFGGAILWDISGDTPEHELGHIVDDILTASTPQPDPDPQPEPEPEPQPEPDPTPVSSANVTLFQNTAMGGDSLEVNEDIECLVDHTMKNGRKSNDETSSISLGKGSLGANLYKECRFSGDKVTYTADATALVSGFNDKVSSVELIKAIAYKDTGYRNTSLNIVGDMEWLGDDLNFNDAMSSIKVAEGYTVRLYAGRNFGGDYVDVTSGQNITDLNSLKSNDKVSSLKVIASVEPEPQPVKEVKAVLYTNANYTGSSISVEGNIPKLVTHGFNDVLSSIKVTPGWVARVYVHENYSGKKIEIKGGEDVPDMYSFRLDEQISSIQIFKAN